MATANARNSTMEEQRDPCGTCGRRFSVDALVRHTNICQKSTKKKRNVFDSAKQRVLGEELTYREIKQAQKAKDATPNPKWRSTHEQLISSFHNARQTQLAINSGGPLPPPPPPSVNPDYVQCGTCGRRFNQKAAERHITFCAEQNKRVADRGKTTQKKSVTATRIEYKPPVSKSKQLRGNSLASPSGAQSQGKVQNLSSPNVKQNHTASNTTHVVKVSGQRMGKNNSATNRYGERVLSQVNNKYIRNHTYSPPNSPNSNYSNGYWDEATCMETSKPGFGQVMRTGKTPQMYEDARREASMSGHSRHTPHAKLSNVPSDDDDDEGEGLWAWTPPGGFAVSRIQRMRPGSNSVHTQESGYGSDTLPVISLTKSKFCHECGGKYPVPDARFCCDCGVKRLMTT